ncbi:phosphopantetheine-binding protein, partial [Streptomyces sp. DSM 41979]
LHHLTTWPLTPNGKLDHTQLPTPTNPTTTTTSAPSTTPHTPHEHLLTTLFATTLNLPTLNTHDNFFTQGGNSLLAIRLTNHINTTLNLNLNTQDIFAHPTPTTLAHHL